jgi:hypothetical protein
MVTEGNMVRRQVVILVLSGFESRPSPHLVGEAGHAVRPPVWKADTAVSMAVKGSTPFLSALLIRVLSCEGRGW